MTNDFGAARLNDETTSSVIDGAAEVIRHS
jgi:hypothetical protein